MNINPIDDKNIEKKNMHLENVNYGGIINCKIIKKNLNYKVYIIVSWNETKSIKLAFREIN